MNISDIITNVISKATGWQQELADNWECIRNNYPQYISLLEILASQGLNEAVGVTEAIYGEGTADSLADTPTAITLGTTSPEITLPASGVWLIQAQVHIAAAAATITTQTLSLKVRRTSGVAADVTPVPVIDLPAMTTLTHSLGIFTIPPTVYVGTAGDVLSIFAGLSAAAGAGTIDAVAIGTSILAQRLA